MTAMSMKNFSGMTPRAPDHLLEDSAASYAKDCDFSRSQLAALRSGLQVLNTNSSTVIRGVYTGDGLRWYTWPTEVVAHKSPVIGEIYNRLYYIENGVFRVSPTPETQGAQYVNGGAPNQLWAVGVPNPAIDKPPKLTLLARTTLADYPNAFIEWESWWTDGSVNYGRGAATAQNEPQYAWRVYEIFPAAKPADTPEGAILVVQATAKDATNAMQLFQMNTQVGAQPAASSALPGGITMTLAVDAQTPPHYFVHFDWGVIETRAYVFTEVNQWDEEGGPSAVSLISPTYLQDVRVEMTHPSFTNYRPRKQSNIYRTYGGSQYIKAGSVTGDIFDDSARTVQSGTGTSLPSLTWVPPVTGLFGLVLAPNGWFAAFKDNTLYMSEPYRPHAWPYSMTFPKGITGICVGSQVIVVTTFEATYVVTGPHPHSATSMMVPIPVGGISHRSMCAVEGGVAFLSNDGIVMVEGSQASLEINQRYFTREVWRTMFKDALPVMQLGYHDGCLVAVPYEPPLAGLPTGFILELDEAGGAMTRYDYVHTALLRLALLDTLYYADGGRVYRFREGNPLSAKWDSKQFITPDYVKLGIGFARMSGSGTITVDLYADEALVRSEPLQAGNRTTYFRLPAHPGALKWQVKISLAGTAKLEDIAFAQTPEELKQV